MKQDTNLVRSAADLERKYDLKGISSLKQNYELQKEGLNKVENELTDFVNVATESLKGLQDQVDGNIATWFFNGVPILDNYPANEWVTDDDKSNHLGDLYYDQDTGYSYRFALTDGVYSWIKLTDSDITKALAIANAAKDTADTKRRVFVEQPTSPYDVGDLWLKNEELYRCQISIGKGESFKESDWIKATKYTDDTVANRVGDDLTVLSGSVLEIKNSVDEHTVQITQTTQLVNEQGERVGTLEKNSSAMQQTAQEISSQVAQTNVVVKDLEKTIEYFAVELEMYNFNVPTDSEGYVLENSAYTIKHYAYYKGQQVEVTPVLKKNINGFNIVVTSSNIQIDTTKGTKIDELNNILEFSFIYKDGDQENILIKKVSVSLALQGKTGATGQDGKDGSGVNILGSFETFEALQQAQPTGSTGDAYLIQGNLYVWNGLVWENVGNIQGPKGDKGDQGEQGLRGLQGPQGEQGIAGKDGTSTYFYIKYSENSSGDPMYDAPTDKTMYMGVASTTSDAAPISYSAYTWFKTQGNDGEQGIQGATGADGRTSYLHIKYSNDGLNFTANNGEEIGRWQGTYVDFQETDSLEFSDYKWVDTAIVVNEQINDLNDKIDDTNINLKENYTNNKDLEQKIEDAKTTVITEMQTVITQTKESWEANVIKKINADGVETLKNNLVIIDIEGIKVATNTSKISTLMSHKSFEIKNSSGGRVAFFGYDETEKKSKAEMDNLTIKNYLTTGYHRTEGFVTEEGEKRTGVFYIGG